MQGPARRAGQLPSRGEHSVSYGELLAAPDGPKLGEFYASALHIGAPFGPSPVAAVAVEVHNFNFKDGTVVGIFKLADEPSACGSDKIARVVADLYVERIELVVGQI